MGTVGNDRTHLVLRGGTRGPNCFPADIQTAAARLRTASLSPHLMVDCSHANSGKDPSRQPAVAAALAEQIAGGERAIVALMLESHLVSGTQSLGHLPLTYGRSITDACLGWEETLPILDQLATAARTRRTLN